MSEATLSQTQKTGRETATAERNTKKGTDSKYGKLVLVTILVLCIPFFQEDISASWSKWKGSSQSQTSGQDSFGKPVKVLLSKDWGTWILGATNGCVWVNKIGANQIQVKLPDGREFDWSDYIQRKKAGEVAEFKWFRLRSDGTMTETTYEFRSRGMCN